MYIFITDGRSVFSTPNQMRCFGDFFPCKFTLTKAPLIPHRPEDLQEVDSDDEEESFLVHYAKSWENACKAKITEEQNEVTYVSRESVLITVIDHSDDELVNTVAKQPHQRFVGRKVRKSFEVGDVKKKRSLRAFEGKVKSYNEKR
jgi:hypothetical protein